ncbi:DUF4395 domain-containing protein [Mucilaginibacter sp. 21P]|uniref:DUF4395 domain-containing protein n=1 Tax=Mucilaginibacter sp. 21P TaxID=2778902 RepID=UPI001C57024F|nr:DUF4395 domain-containing protein [Mucilaginibacter sp. 21P]QXV64287.1 DUF4395 domain-containing protein [Mucilaginibacter sp. 21P]
MQKLECPIDGVRIDETRVRLIAFFVVAFAIAIIFTANPVVAGVLFLDFLLRSLNYGKYSPLNILAGSIATSLKLKSRFVDRGPKRFAALMGTVISGLLFVGLMFGFKPQSQIIAGLLVVFASLESFAGICAGCYIYTWTKQLRPR